ncbi:class I SAM-dependent DNA methyltransferase [Streptomyces salyersiae]|uniref:SAM-dependent methyltransferase n=1 Tax=Streptomyces salyersiae TaxID=3075530 RepID=A0ABU2RP95_9ACTN|nr:SAM-dependent methyltransferase [Streptomyces sp. DSM 41770]MDT0430673.1 SAM-dependent methyltransferase [Streptomyces sp. DSM 41770]
MSTPAGYFEDMYQGVNDPWHLQERWYEQRKYALTLASLPKSRFRSVFEPGCSVGQLTRLLAPRCERLLAADRIASAVDTTRRRTADLAQVEVARLAVPEEWPEGCFDLIVLSELLYYFDEPQLAELLSRATGSLEPGGTLVTVHWNHPVPEHLYTGAQLADRLTQEPGLLLRAEHMEEDFVLQTFSRALPGGAAPLSPAAAEGLV